jgi:malate synthase
MSTITGQRPTASTPAGPVSLSPFGARTPTMAVLPDLGPRHEEVLTPQALAFLAELHVRFAGARHDLLVRRQVRRAAMADGADPGFARETAGIRRDPTWQVAGAGPGLADRRVEITGPTDPKMAVNALSSGAQVWLADLEDATSPTWANVICGQVTLRDAVRGRLEHTSPDGRRYRVEPASGRAPTIVMRPRGWHLVEKHLRYVDRAGQSHPASAALVDFGLFAFHNARELVARGAGPYLYLPKLEGYLEARLWNEVFELAQQRLGLPRGTIRATVLIETITAAFEMEEILYELREHCAGLNAGRWDYIFSLIKAYRGRGPEFVLPDRSAITMTVPPLATYAELLVQTCHRRGAYAIGGMSAAIPRRDDPAATATALQAVAADKRREAGQGFDGSWVAHPGLVFTARAEFDAVLAGRPHQLLRPAGRSLPDDADTAARLLDVAAVAGEVTEAGLRSNVSAAVRYLDAWLRGTGAVAIDSRMEDAATAEISRAQVWQWIQHGVTTREGRLVTGAGVERVLGEVVAGLPHPAGNRLDDAAAVFRDVALGPDLPPFLTTVAYARYL